MKVIDLFAGPGGLGEGFSSLRSSGKQFFNIAVSIEKEPKAHQTLMLRAFLRQFPSDNAPDEYYKFLEGVLGKTPADELYKLTKYRKHVERAHEEARCLELGKDNVEIYKAIRSSIGNKDCIVIGGPPCQAYSLVGRSRNAGKQDYIPELDERNYLYFEYLKVIARFQPLVFIMENVKGLLSAKVEEKLIFQDIKLQLAHPCRTANQRPESNRKSHEYHIVSLVVEGNEDNFAPKDYVVRSEDYGVPQARHRVIFLGIRSDFAARWDESHLLRKSERVSVFEVINDLPRLRSGMSGKDDSFEKWVNTVQSATNLEPALKKHGLENVSQTIRVAVADRSKFSSTRGGTFGIENYKNISTSLDVKLATWYKDPRLKVVCNHESKQHMPADLYRYLFCSAWPLSGKINGRDSAYPHPEDYPDVLKPNHKNFDSGKFANRFRAQVKHLPASTITSHIAKDGHYFIHYDPTQCRSLTVREAARIQTFPDNYFFVGGRTDQYIQVGNAVPPYLARQIAASVAKMLHL